VPRSSFTHKATNSGINRITSVYYIVSYYKNLLQVQKGLSSGKDTILPQTDNQGFRSPRRSLHQSTPHLLSHRQMGFGWHEVWRGEEWCLEHLL
jgi:hypothetical protein